MYPSVDRRAFLRTVGTTILGGIAVGGSVTGCAEPPSADTGQRLLENMRGTGVARIAVANEPPYTEILPDGSVTGAEPEVCRAVMRKFGIPDVTGIVTPYDSMIPGLVAQQWDIVTAGLLMTKTRCARILYSDPVIVSQESFAVPNGNPNHLLTLADVARNPRVRLAVLAGGYEDAIVRTSQVPPDRVSGVADGRSGLESVQAGRADAFLLPTLSLRQLVSDTGGIEITPEIPDIPVTGSGAGFRRTDGSFVRLYNGKLAELKASGEFKAIIEPFGFRADDVMKVTTQQLCQTEA